MKKIAQVCFNLISDHSACIPVRGKCGVM